MRRWLTAAVVVGLGCASGPDNPTSSSEQPPDPKAIGPSAAGQGAVADGADAHVVVFGDRTSQGYLLLVEGPAPTVPSRDDLAALVLDKLAKRDKETEVSLLVKLIATEPPPPGQREPKAITLRDDKANSAAGFARRTSDLLGLHVEVLPIAPQGQPLIPPETFADPILTRELTPDERMSIPRRRHVLLLRADYRNQFGVRGLRLLQTLVRLVATERTALIHDPDTGETMGVEAFTRRRLQASLGNVADQVAVVPFPDKIHGAEFIRLTTRGMRRFGSVDLELDGLPKDPAVLQRATHLMYGLAFQMVRLGEYDRAGYAVELDDIVTVQLSDIRQAYAGRSAKVDGCTGCPGRVELHLVERPREDHDPQDHVVARIVAPRNTSDKPDYDHRGWVRAAIAAILG